MKLEELPWAMISLTIAAILSLTMFSCYQERQETKREVQTACVEKTGNPDCPDPEKEASELRKSEFRTCIGHLDEPREPICEKLLVPDEDPFN